MPVIPAMEGSTTRRMTVQTGLDIKQDHLSKIINAQRAGRVTQAVEPLASKHETEFNP
jgi:hypothetical protein